MKAQKKRLSHIFKLHQTLWKPPQPIIFIRMKNYNLQFLANLVLSVAIISINILLLSFSQPIYKALEVAHVSENLNKEFRIETTVSSFRKYEEIILTTSHSSETNLTMKFQTLVNAKDTTNGYYINFKDHTPYRSIVKAIDLCAKNKLDYLLDHNRLWIFHIRTKQIMGNPPFCSTNLQY